MSLLSELKRRNVFKVSAAYAVVAWIVVQAASSVLPAFDTPPWILQTIIFLILLGFPLALVAAWAFELTPEGIKPSTKLDEHDRVSATRSSRINYITGGALFTIFALAISYNFLFQDITNELPKVTSETTTEGTTDR